ncbi:hypothetical protein DFH09DRAFT_1174915 [Mycena vulgaris]|nr:hypothetical protein DFH09DRAFT_1174915 [Mycena vulgaris]
MQVIPSTTAAIFDGLRRIALGTTKISGRATLRRRTTRRRASIGVSTSWPDVPIFAFSVDDFGAWVVPAFRDPGGYTGMFLRPRDLISSMRTRVDQARSSRLSSNILPGGTW